MDTVQRADFLQRGNDASTRCIVDHKHEHRELALGRLGLNDRRNTDVRLSKHPGDAGQYARLVIDAESEVERAGHLAGRTQFSVEAMRDETEGLARGVERDRGIGQVADHGTCGRILTRAAPVEKRVTHYITPDRDGIEDPSDRSEDVFIRHE